MRGKGFGGGEVAGEVEARSAVVGGVGYVEGVCSQRTVRENGQLMPVSRISKKPFTAEALREKKLTQ